MSEETAPPRYTIHRASRPPSLAAEVGTRPAGWDRAEVGQIGNWHARSGSHRPPVYFRVLHDRQALHVSEAQIDKRDRGRLALGDPEGFPACASGQRLVTLEPQDVAQSLPQTTVVVDDQNPASQQAPRALMDSQAVAPRWAWLLRQGHV